METAAGVLTNPTFLSSLPWIIILIIVVAILIKVFKIKIKTDHFQIGGEKVDAYYERKIVQEQGDFVRTFLNGLIGKITDVCPDHKLVHDGWMTKCILEYVYDEFLDWIHHNHIADNDAYISVKQSKICALVYSFPVRKEFKTPEFEARVKRWVEEVIKELVRIRKVYTEEMKKEGV